MLLFESRDTGVLKDDRNKLFASNEKQIGNYTLQITWFLCLELCDYIILFNLFYGPSSAQSLLHDVPLHLNISIHILHTVLYTIPNVLAGRNQNNLKIKRFFSCLSFPLFS